VIWRCVEERAEGPADGSGRKAERGRRGPGRRWAGKWRLGSHLLGSALLLGFSCHGSAHTPAPARGEAAPDPAAAAERVRVFLIAPRDGGRGGRKVACDDSAVPVEVTLPRAAPALESSLRALLGMGDRYDRASGLLNPLYASRLELAGVERRGVQARVRLSGYVELGDACDNARILAQLTETALQFRGIAFVQFEVDGRPLRALLLGGAPNGPAAPPGSPELAAPGPAAPPAAPEPAAPGLAAPPGAPATAVPPAAPSGGSVG
jgi:hypothetical protein